MEKPFISNKFIPKGMLFGKMKPNNGILFFKEDLVQTKQSVVAKDKVKERKIRFIDSELRLQYNNNNNNNYYYYYYYYYLY